MRYAIWTRRMNGDAGYGWNRGFSWHGRRSGLQVVAQIGLSATDTRAHGRRRWFRVVRNRTQGVERLGACWAKGSTLKFKRTSED